MKQVLARLAVVALFAVISMPTTAQAQGLKIGPHVGLNMDGSDLFLGVGTQFNLPIDARQMWGNIELDLYPFIKNVTSTRVSANVLLPFRLAGLQLYGGGGLIAQFQSFDLPAGSPLDDSDTDIGLNLKAGFLLGSAGDGYRPFVEFDQTVGAGSDFSLRGGIFMAIGGR
ncbi:MAG: hypothetical protein O3B41_11530 [Bacteroidetes bacterium]|nr:hypothetical protein [Bacteroidota bacterium]